MMVKEYQKNFDFLDFMIVFLSIALKYLKLEFKINDSFMAIYFLFLCVFVLLKFVKYPVTKKNLLYLMFILLYCLIITYSTASVDFALSLLLVLIFYNKGYKQYLYYLFISSAICFIITIILSNVGILQSEVLTRKVDGVIVTRNSLGFQTVNGAFLHWFVILLLYYYLFGFKKYSFIILLAISWYIYLSTNTRTGFYCTILFMILAPMMNLGSGKLLKKSAKYLFIIFSIISFVFACKLGISNNALNELVSNRFVLWNNAINNYSIQLLVNHALDTYPIDNLYINFWQHYGIVAYFGLLLLYFFGMNKIKDKKLLITMFFFLMYCLFESNHYYYINYSFFILMYVLIVPNYQSDKKGGQK